MLEYYRGVESGLNELKMALNQVFAMYYVTDSQHDEENGELGCWICKYCYKQLISTPIVSGCALIFRKLGKDQVERVYQNLLYMILLIFGPLEVWVSQ